MNALLKGSWRTTLLGIVTILSAISTAAKAELDDDPATSANWGEVAMFVMAGSGLIASRDNKVSSESAGAK